MLYLACPELPFERNSTGPDPSLKRGSMLASVCFYVFDCLLNLYVLDGPYFMNLVELFELAECSQIRCFKWTISYQHFLFVCCFFCLFVLHKLLNGPLSFLSTWLSYSN